MAQLPITKSVAAVTERLVRGGLPINTTPLLSLTALPVTGLFVVSFTAAIASVAAAISALQEFTVTATGDKVVLAVGDLFIPFAPALALGTGAGAINAGLALHPARVVTAHKLPLLISNSTAGALDPDNTLTIAGLIIKL